MFKSKEYKYPIAEIFTSPQGEGTYSGQLQTFIRLAGCTVGKPYSKERYENPVQPDKCTSDCDPDIGHKPNCAVAKYFQEKSALLPIYTEKCTILDGRTMECDTDYRVKERLFAYEIIALLPQEVKYVCISGGEPMMHPLTSLVDILHNAGKEIRLETSGTIPLNKTFTSFDSHAYIWITCSPKFKALPEMLKIANEIKLLVDEKFDPYQLPEEILKHQLVWLQPINFENKVNMTNLKLCLDWQKKFPNWRISVQMHKIMNVR
jgi:organic radical activating enzyme